MVASPALEAKLPVAPVEVNGHPGERNWTDVIEDLLSAESSSHTTLEQSTITSINSKASMPLQKALLSHGTTNPRDLLLACASAVDNSDYVFAKALLIALEQSMSIYGDPLQRVSTYVVEGLAARMELALDGISSRLSKMMRDPSLADKKILKETQVLYHCCPYFIFGYLVANGAIAEAFRNEPYIHIIDFDINQGNQLQMLIGAFAQQPGRPPLVRITGVADPKVQTSLEGVRRRLEDVARHAIVPFEFKPLEMEVSKVEPWMLDIREGETLL